MDPFPQKNVSQRGLGFVLITLFLDIMGSTLLMPIIPYLIREYDSDALTIGMLSAVYAASAFLAAPLLGFLSDRWGRRPVLLASILGSALGYFLFGFGEALWVLFIARLIDGFTGGNISTAMAYIADVTPPKERARAYGFGGVAFGLGFFVGPIVSGALSEISLAAPAFAAGGMSLAAFLFGLAALPESLPKEKRIQARMSLRDLNPLGVMIKAGSLQNLTRLFAGIFILYLSLNGLFSYIAVYTLDRFGTKPAENAVLFMGVGLAQMLGQGLLVYHLTSRLGEKTVALIGMVTQGFAYLLFLLAPVFAWLFPLALISALGNALSRPTLDAMVANSVAPHEQGRAAGVSAGLYSLTSVLGPLLFGIVYDGISPGAVFLAAGCLIWIASGVVYQVAK